MKLIVIQETDWIQRGPHQQHHMFERLSNLGHQIKVLDFEINYKPWPLSPLIAPRLEWENINKTNTNANINLIRPATIRIPGIARIVSIITFYLELKKITKTFQPDAIINYAVSTGLCGLAIAKLHNIPFVFHVIDALHTLVPQKWLQPLTRLIESLILIKANTTIYINQGLKDYGISHGANPKSAFVIRTGVDLNMFKVQDETTISSVRTKWHIKPDDIVLIFVGWLYPFSGIDTVMKILPKLPETLKLMVVGSGQTENELRLLANKLCITNRVIFTKQQPYNDMVKLISAADVCLLFSEINSTTQNIVPIKAYEYLACSKPVIASKLPGLMQDIPPGNGILYISPNDLSQTILSIIDTEYRIHQGNKARDYVEQNSDWSNLTLSFEKLLNNIIHTQDKNFNT
mgnify:FL=1|tara:strand:- start:9109 stop:10320 length:1212 start_codon:yes stop_codon:yes gene_type:complete